MALSKSLGKSRNHPCHRSAVFYYLPGRIFIFGTLGYFNLGALLEGLRRLMSYKLALHVFVRFTEQVVPLQKHITSFWIPSISGTKTVTMKLMTKAAVRLSDHTHVTYLLSTSLSGVFRGRRARHLPWAPLFGAPPLRCYARKFSLVLMKNLLFTHIIYYKANHK